VQDKALFGLHMEFQTEIVEPELCTSTTEKGNFIFNIDLLYFTNVFKSFTQKVKLFFDIFFRHLKPQGVADITESALLSGA